MKWLGTFRGLAILLVVISHAPYYGMLALTQGGWNEYLAGKSTPASNWSWIGSTDYYALIGLNQLGLASVPLFLFASGFFAAYAARSNQNRISWSAVRGWIKSVIRPYVVWLILSVLAYALIVFVGRRLPNIGTLIERRLLDYYYVPLLVQLMLLAPVLAWLAFRRPILLLYLSAALEGTVALLHYVTYLGVQLPGILGFANLWNWVIFWQWIFFYSLGLVVFRYYEPVRRRLAPVHWQLLSGAVALGILSIVETATLHRFDQQYVDNLSWKASTALYALALILTLVSWDWRRGRVVSVLERLGTLSLGIYLIQPIAIDYGAKIIYSALPQYFLHQVFLQPVLIASGVGVPIIVMWVVARSPIRRYHHPLFGSHAPASRPTPGRLRPGASQRTNPLETVPSA